MTFRIDKIEIQQQPERKRYWAEVEVLTPSGFRRKRLETPDTDGHWGILNAIGAYCDEYAPKPAVGNPDVGRFVGAFQSDESGVHHGELTRVDTSGIPTAVTPEMFDPAAATLNTLNLLRAEAEAAGVRVDKRWGEARLREEIARGMADQDWQDAQEER